MQAHTVEDTAVAVPSAPGQTASRVRVAWTDDTGALREGRADVVIGTKAGSPVTVWLDRTGAVVAPPRTPADSAAVGAAAGLVIVMVGWALLWGVFRLIRLPLVRQRVGLHQPAARPDRVGRQVAVTRRTEEGTL